MKLTNILRGHVAATAIFITSCGLISLSSCSSGESYSDLLNDENQDVNRFLADQLVAGQWPGDNYEYGENAPYYQIDDDGALFMKVLDPGNPDDMAQYNDQIYFRFDRAALREYTSWDALVWSGNATTLPMGSASFRFDNYTLSSTSQYGEGLQAPLKYLGVGCQVYLVVKSTVGIQANNENASVIPYLYRISYHRSPLVD